MKVHLIEPDPVEAARLAAVLSGVADVQRSARILPSDDADVAVLALPCDGLEPEATLDAWAEAEGLDRPVLVCVGQACGASLRTAGRLGAVAVVGRHEPLERFVAAVELALAAAERRAESRRKKKKWRRARLESLERLALHPGWSRRA